MISIPSELFDEDAGAVLAAVVCQACGSKVVGVVQERWTTPTPRGEVIDAMLFRGYLGKARRSDGARGRATAVSPVWRGRTVKHAICPRHGQLVVDLARINRDTRGAVVNAVLQRETR